MKTPRAKARGFMLMKMIILRFAPGAIYRQAKARALLAFSIRSSCEATRGGGRLSPTNVSLRCAMILSTAAKSVMKAMTFLFLDGRLLAFHNHLRIVCYLKEHLADRLEQGQPFSPKLVLISRTTSFSAAGGAVGLNLKTAVAVESSLCNLICISQDGIYFEAMALDKRIK